MAENGPLWRKTAPLKRPIKRSMIVSENFIPWTRAFLRSWPSMNTVSAEIVIRLAVTYVDLIKNK